MEWPVEKIAIGIWRAEEPRYEYSVVMRAPPGEPCVPGKGEGKMIGTTRYRCRLRPRLVALRCICEREMHRHIVRGRAAIEGIYGAQDANVGW